MKLPSKERIIGVGINLAIIAVLALAAIKILQANEIMLIPKEAKEAVIFCKSRPELCLETKRVYEANLTSPLFKVIPAEVGE